MILFHFNTKLKIEKKMQIKRWLSHVAIQEGKKISDLSYIFCNDDDLVKMNKKYLKKDSLTDVLAFQSSNTEKIEGDVFISVERVKVNAKKYNTAFKNELNRVMVHGLLHLLGYEDKKREDKQEMQKKENIYLKNITI